MTALTSHRKSRLSLALAALAFTGSAAWLPAQDAAAPVAPAPATGETQQQLIDRIRALEETVKQLKADRTATPATRQADAVDRGQLVDAAIRRAADAAAAQGFSKSTGINAGYRDGRFIIQSDDGNFLFNPSVGMQFRYIADFRDGSKNIDADDNQSGFETRRLKFAFDGNLFTKDLTYRFQWATNRKTGVPELDEGWARYNFHDTPWSIQVGTMADVWDRETGVSYRRQLAVERSLLHELISSGGLGGEDYVQGVQGLYGDKNTPLRAFVLFHDGFNSRNTNFQDGQGGAPVLGLKAIDYAVAGRVEYKFDGDWEDYRQFTALGNKRDLLVVGGGFDYEDGDNIRALLHTVDIQYVPQSVKGLALYAAYVGLARDFRNISTANGVSDSPYDWGFLAQASYLLDEKWEVFARYDFTRLDDSAPTGTGTLGAAARVEDNIHEITVGLNYYWFSHNAKFTVDATWLPNGSPISLDGAGILSQPNDKDQFLFRAQFQLLL